MNSNQHKQSGLSRYFQPQSAAWWDSFFLGVLLLAMCSQINIGDIGQDTTKEGYVTKQLKIALPDIALLLNFGWFLARTTMLRAWKKLWWPPLPCWALIFALLLAFVHSDSIWNKAAQAVGENPGGLSAQLKAALKDKGTFQAIKEGVAEVIQYGLYFLIAPWLFVNLIHDRRQTPFLERRQFALGTFALAVGLAAIHALIQGLQKPAIAPQAGFGSPNAFNGFIAIALPLVFVLLVGILNRSRVTQAFATLPLIALFFTMSLWANVAFLFGSLFGLFAAPRKMRIGLVLWAGLSIIVLVNFTRQANTSRHPRAEFLRLGSATQPVKKQYVEWYAAQSFAVPSPRRRAFATGVGPGNYQINIGEYYASLPNEEKMPPDSNNLYLVQAVSIGLLGLSALVWVVFHFAHLAWRARKYFADDWLASGVLASLAAWLFVNLFHAMIVRGAGVVLAFVLSLAVIAARLNVPRQSTLSSLDEANLTERHAQPDV